MGSVRSIQRVPVLALAPQAKVMSVQARPLAPLGLSAPLQIRTIQHKASALNRVNPLLIAPTENFVRATPPRSVLAAVTQNAQQEARVMTFCVVHQPVATNNKVKPVTQSAICAPTDSRVSPQVQNNVAGSSALLKVTVSQVKPANPSAQDKMSVSAKQTPTVAVEKSAQTTNVSMERPQVVEMVNPVVPMALAKMV